MTTTTTTATNTATTVTTPNLSVDRAIVKDLNDGGVVGQLVTATSQRTAEVTRRDGALGDRPETVARVLRTYGYLASWDDRRQLLVVSAPSCGGCDSPTLDQLPTQACHALGQLCPTCALECPCPTCA